MIVAVVKGTFHKKGVEINLQIKENIQRDIET